MSDPQTTIEHSPNCQIYSDGNCDCKNVFFIPKDWLFKTERHAQDQTHGKVVKVRMVK